MDFKFKTTGGFMGLNLSYENQIQNLPEKHKIAFNQLLDEKPIANALEKLSNDVFEYSIEFTDKKLETIKLNDLNIPDKYISLINYLRKCSEKNIL
jgi:hypothetical protein